LVTSRGAFTDAHRDQRGLIAMAEHGTLFLDEVDSLSTPAQAKLLRFLQERTYRPLGADKFVRAEVNVLAATNRDLEKMVSEQRFRSDLFFRLNVLRLHMIPLRERRGDIPILAHHFVELLCAEQGQLTKSLAATTVDQLMRADWPGNVRQLESVIQGVVARRPMGTVVLQDLPTEYQSVPWRRLTRMERAERQAILQVLAQTGGNKARAAELLGVGRATLYRKLKQLGVTQPRETSA
jgi:DNA-binding NtrC family response regulator